MSLRASSLDWGCPPKSTDFRWLKRVVEGHIGHGPKRHWRTLHGFFSTDDIPHFTCLKFSRPHTSSGGHVQSFSQRTDQGSTSNVHECVHIWRCSAPCVHEFSHTGQRSPASVHKCVHHDRCSTSSVHETDHNGKTTFTIRHVRRALFTFANIRRHAGKDEFLHNCWHTYWSVWGVCKLITNTDNKPLTYWLVSVWRQSTNSFTYRPMVTELINNTFDQFSTTFMCGQVRESDLLYESEEEGNWNN